MEIVCAIPETFTIYGILPAILQKQMWNGKDDMEIGVRKLYVPWPAHL